jgi:Zn ribbon nucleic-acid-binding protein
MTSIKDFTDKGFTCPSCNSKELRAGYHDYQNMDSFICTKCGLRWQEDTNKVDGILNLMHNLSPEDWKTRFIWVLHVANRFDMPLKNSASADEKGTIRDFIVNGLRRRVSNE